MKYLIIPDVHGRSFWREPVIKSLDDDTEKIIFLGDYLDPYDYENIDSDEAYNGLLDIIKYKKTYPDKFILLLGNHDMHYLSVDCKGSRFDYRNAARNEKIFFDNLDLFQLTYDVEVNGKVFYFSHAGVNLLWIRNNIENLDIVCDDPDKYTISDWKELPNFNELFKDQSIRGKHFIKSLGDVSVLRGGSSTSGSILWADYRDHVEPTKSINIPGIIQVFGHTQQEAEPVNIDNEMFCLDVRRVFYLNEQGEIIDSNTNTTIPTVDRAELEKEIKEYIEKLMKFSWFF